MLKNSLNYYIKKNFDYFIFSNADILISKKIIKILKLVKIKDYMGFVYPNTLIKNGKIINSFTPHYGIDFIVFKLTKKKAKFFLKLLNDYEQYIKLIDQFRPINCSISKEKYKINAKTRKFSRPEAGFFRCLGQFSVIFTI